MTQSLSNPELLTAIRTLCLVKRKLDFKQQLITRWYKPIGKLVV